MYDTIQLDKNLYHLDGKSFTHALNELDPDEAYQNHSELQGLDAYERQLKRFDIKINGKNADQVDRFFQTAQSAVLFPEFVRRAIESGMNLPALREITAARSLVNTSDCRGITLEEANSYDTGITEGSAMPESTVKFTGSLVTMTKFGRTVSISYETIRQQRLDAFAISLKCVGAQLAAAVLKQAAAVLQKDAEIVHTAGAAVTYSDLVKLWGSFESGCLTTILCSPKAAADILSFEQMKFADHILFDQNAKNSGLVQTPFGVTIVKCPSLTDTTLIGLDNACALELIQNGGVIVEAEKLVSRQMEQTTVSVTTGFSKIRPESVKVLTTKA